MDESFRETDRWRNETEQTLVREVESLRAELAQIRSTRLWRSRERVAGAKKRFTRFGNQDGS